MNVKQPRVKELVGRLITAFSERDWDAVAELYHPEAELSTVASGAQALTGAEMIERFKKATADGVYEVEVDGIEEIDPSTCIASGRVRSRLPGGGMADSPKSWLYVFRDGLLWRGSIHASRDEALTAYVLAHAPLE